MGVLSFLKRKKSKPTSMDSSAENSSSTAFQTSKNVTNPPMGINSNKVKQPKVSDELLPIVTLMSHQQQREYYIGDVEYIDQSEDLSVMDWTQTQISLKGSNLTIINLIKPLYINICDCELNLSGDELEVYVIITEHSQVVFRFQNEDELIDFYSAILLSKFEYTQLQEGYTGALLSSEAIHFSDIRTLLDPNNRRHSKEEWCVLRFPYLNGKWIRCLVVIKPTKIEVYLNANKSKKHLLATIIDGKTIHGVYSGHTNTIKENSLIRIWGDCYIDVDLLNKILNNDGIDNKSLTNIRRNSISKRLSIGSFRSHDSTSSSSNTSKLNQHRRVQSIDTQISDNNSFNSKTPKKLVKRDIVQTHLMYIIPETHGGIKPVEIMLRMMIPIMNTFELYGRPNKFISSRNEKESLLFGLPQLPETQYLSSQSARELVSINLKNSLDENWGISDWNMVFKELVNIFLERQEGDATVVKYTKPENLNYDPELDFLVV